MTIQRPEAPACADPGFHAYVGAPGYGKTFRALLDFRAYVAASRVGGIVVDSASVEGLRSIPQAVDLRDAIERVFARGEVIRVVPRDVDEFDSLMRVARNPGGIALFVDELSFWSRSKELERLCRTWRHARCSIYVTLQHIGADLAQTLLSCNPRMRVFRVSAPRSIEFLMRWHGMSPDEIRDFGVGFFDERQF